jgi:type II secretory pathway component GspD/PulD (secretin)/beta-lactamase regulating signal transducer with metallopeptidase domain
MFAIEKILSAEMVQKLGWSLIHFIWQAAAVAIIAAVLLRILRRFSANLRYALTCLALGLVVLLPVVTMRYISVSVSVSTDVTPASEPVVLPMPPAIEIPTVKATTYVEEKTVIPASAKTNYFPIWKQRVIGFLESSMPNIVTIWLLGVLGFSLWHLGGWTQLQRLRSRLVRPVDAFLKDTLSIIAERLCVKQAVELLESAIVQIPTVVGWVRPVILLPASALTGLSREQLAAILAHELAHIRRFDYLVNMLQTVVEILGFYNPAIWWLSHRIRVERENCCDDLAVSVCGDRISYARALASLEEIRSQSELAIAATGGNFFARISRIVGKDYPQKTKSWIPAVIIITLLIALAIPTTLALATKSNLQNYEPNTAVTKKSEVEETWGQAMEGIQFQFKPEQTVWEQGQSLRFLLDIRNIGQKTVRIYTENDQFLLEWDGLLYYKIPGSRFGPGSGIDLKPGGTLKNISVVINQLSSSSSSSYIPPWVISWRSRESVQPIKLTPGKHKVRIAQDPRSSSISPTIFSNPVEIEIMPTEDNTVAQVESAQSSDFSGIKTRRIYLPDLETPDVNVVLDLASGQMLSAKSMEKDDTYFEKLGKGDLAYEYAQNQSGLLCLRGAKMELMMENGSSSLKPDVERTGFVVYFIKNVPSQFRITTEEGNKYDLNVISINKGDKGGINIEYKKTFVQNNADKPAVQADTKLNNSKNSIKPLSAEKVGEMLELLVGEFFGNPPRHHEIDLNLIYQSLIGPQAALRLLSAQYLGRYGNSSSIPYLIDALSDESRVVGYDIFIDGDVMNTVRYWANDSLKKLTGKDFGFIWDDPKDKRNEAIQRWQQWWDNNKVLTQGKIEKTAEPNEEMINLSVSNLALRNILDLLAKLTGKKITAADEAQKINIMVYAPNKIPKSKAIQLIYGAINESGFIIAETEDVIYIKPKASIQNNEILTVTDIAALRKIEDQNQIVRAYFKLKYLYSYEAASIISSLSKNVNFGFDVAGILEVIDTAGNLQKYTRLIEQLDVDAAKESIHVFPLKYRNPTEMVQLLHNIIANDKSLDLTSPGETADRKEIVLVPVPERNWIIVRILPEYLKRIQFWVEKLDVPSAAYSSDKLLSELKADPNEFFKTYASEVNQPQSKVLIETKIIQVRDNFLKEVGLDANSLKESSLWSKYRISEANGYSRFILDELNADLFLKTVEARKDCRILFKPQVIAIDGKAASIKVLKEEWFMMSPPKKSSTRELEKVEAGTVLSMTPAIKEGNKIQLVLDLKISDFNESASRKTPKGLPGVDMLFAESSTDDIPIGNSLLIIGKKVTKSVESSSKTPILGDLPIVGRLFRARSLIKDYYIPVMLIKPTILTKEQEDALKLANPTGQKETNKPVKPANLTTEQKKLVGELFRPAN